MKTVSGIVIALALLVALPAEAATTMETIWNEPHAAPQSFTTDGFGGFYGVLSSGESFTQQPLVTDTSIRIHKFAIGSAYFYVSDRGFIKADTDLVAISMYLARA